MCHAKECELVAKFNAKLKLGRAPYRPEALGMPTHGQYSSVYDPETLRALQDIFDSTWAELNAAAEPVLTGEQAENRRVDLVQMILLAHKSGLSPEEIKAAILGDGAASPSERY